MLYLTLAIINYHFFSICWNYQRCTRCVAFDENEQCTYKNGTYQIQFTENSERAVCSNDSTCGQNLCKVSEKMLQKIVFFSLWVL